MVKCLTNAPPLPPYMFFSAPYCSRHFIPFRPKELRKHFHPPAHLFLIDAAGVWVWGRFLLANLVPSLWRLFAFQASHGAGIFMDWRRSKPTSRTDGHTGAPYEGRPSSPRHVTSWWATLGVCGASAEAVICPCFWAFLGPLKTTVFGGEPGVSPSSPWLCPVREAPRTTLRPKPTTFSKRHCPRELPKPPDMTPKIQRTSSDTWKLVRLRGFAPLRRPHAHVSMWSEDAQVFPRHVLVGHLRMDPSGASHEGYTWRTPRCVAHYLSCWTTWRPTTWLLFPGLPRGWMRPMVHLRMYPGGSSYERANGEHPGVSRSTLSCWMTERSPTTWLQIPGLPRGWLRPVVHLLMNPGGAIANVSKH